MNFSNCQDDVKAPARIEHVRVENYRALRRVEFPMGPVTVLLGPNGSGKSTLFDVFSFLSDCFRHSLRYAWDKRGRAREIRTRGSTGPVIIEIKYREQPALPLITYHLAIDEEERGPVVVEEWLQWRRGQRGKPFRFLEYRRGEGRVISGEMPDEKDQRVDVPLRSPDLIAVNTLGQIAEHPRVAALREFIMGWYLSYLSLADTRGQPEAGPQERLSRTGDNLPNVIQFLKEQHPDRLQKIEEIMRQRVPRLASVVTEIMPDGRLLLQIKDAPFDQPILSRFASDGTLKMLAYLTILYGPNPPPFIGIEEPENFLYPHLLPGLAEECRAAAEFAQILISTHSPTFVNWFRPEEVLVLSRDHQGYTRIAHAADIRGVREFLDTGARLGDLWLEGYLTSP
jgi:predicted ATPase